MAFKIIAEDGMARIGVLEVRGKTLQTPFFMPVMTKGSVKNLSPEQLKETKTSCCISNSLILSLKPGATFLSGIGIHTYSNWQGGIFTDSGGFQMLSNSLFKGIDNEKVTFKNPFTGKDQEITPEDSMRLQMQIGSDVAMVLDHVPSYYTMTREKMIECCNRTHYWAWRCKLAHDALNTDQLLFGIAQGGVYTDLRKKSAQEISAIGFDGIALGGFCFGESDIELYQGIEAAKSVIPKKYPIYVMGMGHPLQILESIARGCDIFDSTFPTMSARHGTIFTKNGPLRILNKKYAFDMLPLDSSCNCYACKHYTRAYIHTLLQLKENFAKTLATIHNIYFIQSLISDARDAISSKTFQAFLDKFKDSYPKDVKNAFKYS